MQTRRILIVDDDVSAASLLKLLLERTGGFEVRTENRGSLALSAALDFQPELVLMDVVMPGIDGGDVAFQMRANKQLRHVPIVFLTSLVTDEEAAAQSTIDFPMMAKPVNAQELIRLMERLLAQKAACLPARA